MRLCLGSSRTWIPLVASGMYASLRATLQLRLTFNQIECPRAAERIRVGIPSTVEQASHGLASSAGIRNGPSTSLIVTATENFITFIDALRISMTSKDLLHPLLGDVIQSVNKVTTE